MTLWRIHNYFFWKLLPQRNYLEKSKSEENVSNIFKFASWEWVSTIKAQNRNFIVVSSAANTSETFLSTTVNLRETYLWASKISWKAGNCSWLYSYDNIYDRGYSRAAPPGENSSMHVINNMYLLRTCWLHDSPTNVYVAELGAQELQFLQTTYYMNKENNACFIFLNCIL